MRVTSAQLFRTSGLQRSNFVWTSEVAPRRILIVDDDPALLALMRILLISSDYEVDTAANGQQGLQLARSGDYALILLDLEMPVMNGREFYRQYRAEGRQTPIVLVSAYGAELARAELAAEGAVAKPFDPDHLAFVVDSLVKT